MVGAVEGPVEHAREKDAGRAAEVPRAVVAAARDQRLVGLARVLGHPGRVTPQDHEEGHRRPRQAEALEGGDDTAPARDHAEHDRGRGHGQTTQADVEDRAGSDGKEEEEEREAGGEGQEPQREGPGRDAGQSRLEAERAEGDERAPRRGEAGRDREERHEERGARVGSHSPGVRRASSVYDPSSSSARSTARPAAAKIVGQVGDRREQVLPDGGRAVAVDRGEPLAADVVPDEHGCARAGASGRSRARSPRGRRSGGRR